MVLAEKLLFAITGLIGKLSLQLLPFILLTILLLWQLKRMWGAPLASKNPFSLEFIRDPQPLVMEKDKREAVLKDGFSSKKIPTELDAIVIGSGIGGLTTAALMAKSGKKVLVLEQHDQAGGCCHTFIEKGFEFDVGIHYIGNIAGTSMNRVFIDQLTDGQLDWVPLDEIFDTVVIGDVDHSPRIVPIAGTGPENFKKKLIEIFPKEEKGITDLFALLKKARKSMAGFVLMKTLPLWLAKFAIRTGLVNVFTDFFKYSGKSVKEVIDELLKDDDLKAVLAYNFGDYGTCPKDAPFIMQSTLLNHFINGAYYPKGGASEIAFHIIPVIRRSGGSVLVRAPVTNILTNELGRAIGVRVHKGGAYFDIKAPLVISDAGLYNTYERLLPADLQKQPEIQRSLSYVTHGPGAMTVFVGLDATKEELGVKAQNFWVYTSNDFDTIFEDYVNLSASEAGTTDIPLLFISFPSTKDPTWEDRFPGKTTCAIVTLANYEWFSEWDGARVGKRGDDYEDIKNRIGERMWKQTIKLFPQIADHRVYFEVGSPVTNNYYIGSPRGEIYGLDHDKGRFSPEAAALLRAKTPVPGLLLTGQDLFTCGFSGAMFGGLLAASEALNRNCFFDLMKITGQLKTQEAKKMS